ncbi:hypothetical protein WG901_13295 [Novosphingobium sp. PS1R-30]|uniref:Uncharacterized protein n=1 Tax=Novosphingobium anseongense TaxID=3133436 RepID=A0ABU8RX69_9SPHN
MRIKIAGAYSLWEFEDALDRIVQSLRSNGVSHLRAINLYLSPFRANTKLIFEDQETGRPFEVMHYAGSRRREFAVVSPRLQPERDAVRITDAIPHLNQGTCRGYIEDFIGLLEQRSGATCIATGSIDQGVNQ